MSDLVAFLAARLAADGAGAEDFHDAASCESCMGAPGPFPCNCGHPARVLREVAAKRAILAEHAPTDWTAYADRMCRRCVWNDEEPHDELHHWVIWPCPTVRALAAIYSDHPDYRQEWKAV